MKKIILRAVEFAIIAILWCIGCNDGGTNSGNPNGDGEVDRFLVTVSGMFTDSRDGKAYRAVRIGNHMWMAENLNYQTTTGSWCYGENSSNCSTYGRLYDWSAAMNINTSYNNKIWNSSDVGHQGVCPNGWHVPSRSEWNQLLRTTGGASTSATRLKSRVGWKRVSGITDEYEFSALPSGFRGTNSSDFYEIGNQSIWWTATSVNDSAAYAKRIYGDSSMVSEFNYYKTGGFSVRCVQDIDQTKASIGYDLNTIEMIFVAGGTFTMGCTKGQMSDCKDDENPSHTVTVSDFYIGKYEVTQELWKAVMESNPSSFIKNGDLPIETVSWNQVQTFIQVLNSKTGKKYRLPTEAEWEYAAQGGASNRGYTFSGSNTLWDVAWYSGNSSNRTHLVGTQMPNELGIYDMNGNVEEWVNDWFGTYSLYAQTNPAGPTSGTHRVVRGGSYSSGERDCQLSRRWSFLPDAIYKDIGFRLARSSQ